MLTWTGDLAPGGTVTITFTATVHDPDTGDKTLAAAAASAAAGSSCPPGSGTAGCDIAIPVLTPALTITTAASPATATPGRTVTYTLTVTDSGQTPYAGATVTDDLTGLLDDAAYNGDAAATAGTVAFTSPVLTWTGDLAPGGTATITYSVTVHNPDTGDKILTGTLASTAAGTNCPASGGTDPRCTTTVTVAQLIINSTADVSTTTPGGVVHYTTTLTNTGQAPYHDITMSSDASGLIDDAAGNADQTATSGSFTIGTTGAVWTGDIPVGGTVTLAGSVTVNNPDTGDHVLTEINTSDAPGSNCPAGSTDPRCGTTIDVLTPALTIVTTANATAAVPGQQVTFTLTVTDTGQTPYSGAVVTDSFAQMGDDAVYNGDATATTGALSYASPRADLDREPVPRRQRRHHLHRHRQQPRHRRQAGHHHRHLRRRRLYLPARHHQQPLPGHRPRPHPGPDHRQDRFDGHRHPGPAGDLHDHGHRHRPDPVHRRRRHR